MLIRSHCWIDWSENIYIKMISLTSKKKRKKETRPLHPSIPPCLSFSLCPWVSSQSQDGCCSPSTSSYNHVKGKKRGEHPSLFIYLFFKFFFFSIPLYRGGNLPLKSSSRFPVSPLFVCGQNWVTCPLLEHSLAKSLSGKVLGTHLPWAPTST